MNANAGRMDLDATLRLPTVHPGEPVFLLRAQDAVAADAARAWAALAHARGVDHAVVEQALRQADRMAEWSPTKLPDAGHLADHERLQLAYAFSRRAWGARDDADGPHALAIALAERRGWDACLGAARARAAEEQG